MPIEDFQNDEQTISELTLLLVALTSWQEKICGLNITQAWKGYDFRILDQLKEKGYVFGSKKSKLTTLTDEGLKKAEELSGKYLKSK
jgi:hypothetical protein